MQIKNDDGEMVDSRKVRKIMIRIGKMWRRHVKRYVADSTALHLEMRRMQRRTGGAKFY